MLWPNLFRPFLKITLDGLAQKPAGLIILAADPRLAPAACAGGLRRRLAPWAKIFRPIGLNTYMRSLSHICLRCSCTN